MKQILKIQKEWNALKTDTERWTYLFANKDKLRLGLDNDCTQAEFHYDICPDGIEDLSDLPDLNNFDEWLGWSDGVWHLLTFIGIEAEPV